MPLDSYRDAQTGLGARLAEVAARIREREDEVAETFWASLEPMERERLASLRDALDVLDMERTEVTFAELARAETLAAQYLDEVERIVARLPTLEEEWCALPAEVPDPPPSTPGFGRAFDLGLLVEERAGFERAFAATVRDSDREAEIIIGETYPSVEARSVSCLAHLSYRDAPFSLRATAHPTSNGLLEEVSMCLVTSVPRAMPRLLVRHESLLVAMSKTLGLKREVDLGDPSFDGLFFVEGNARAVRRLLGGSVRRELLKLARFDVPTLEIDPPNRVASLAWRFEPQPGALRAALRVLASIRETHAEVRFRT